MAGPSISENIAEQNVALLYNAVSFRDFSVQCSIPPAKGKEDWWATMVRMGLEDPLREPGAGHMSYDSICTEYTK